MIMPFIFCVRWHIANRQVMRDQCRRYVYLKGQPYPILVSIHKDIAEAFDAFQDHDDFGESCPKPNRYYFETFFVSKVFFFFRRAWAEAKLRGRKHRIKLILPASPWLLNKVRPFNVKFESELPGDDGRVPFFKQLSYNFDVLVELNKTKKFGAQKTFSPSASDFMKSFVACQPCDGTKKDPWRKILCWFNRCGNPKCNIMTPFVPGPDGKTPWESEYCPNISANHMVKWGCFETTFKNNVKNYRFDESFVSVATFFEKFRNWLGKEKHWFFQHKLFWKAKSVTLHIDILSQIKCHPLSHIFHLF